jgi:hypothetical protein
MDELELNFNIDLDLDFNIDLNIESDSIVNSRICKPNKIKQKDSFVKSNNAKTFFENVTLEKDCRIHCILNGNFQFFDMIFELFVKYQIKVKKMTISTLSLSQDNIESMAVLLENGYIEELNLIVSDFFYSHEKHQLIPFIYNQLDIDNKFQLAVAGTHCKIITFETVLGTKFCIHGSANLRSSNNIEQVCIENNDDLYYFYDEMHDKILNYYKTINKPIRTKLWQLMKD